MLETADRLQLIEQKLRLVWSEILSKDEITLDSNFFELGGESIQLMTMLFRIGDIYSVDIPPGVVFENPTLRQLAVFVRDNTGDTP